MSFISDVPQSLFDIRVLCLSYNLKSPPATSSPQRFLCLCPLHIRVLSLLLTSETALSPPHITESAVASSHQEVPGLFFTSKSPLSPLHIR